MKNKLNNDSLYFSFNSAPIDVIYVIITLARGRMEFPTLGKHCSFKECKQLGTSGEHVITLQ